MSFKRRVLLFFCLVFVGGCSDFINGKRKQESVITPSDRFSCLSELPPVLRDLTSDQSDPEKTRKTIVCLEDSLKYFVKRTVGSVEDGYSVLDMRKFFGKYLGDDGLITDSMATEMMKIKMALFGGSEKMITKSELLALVEVLELSRDEIQNLKPYWGLVVLKSYQNPDSQQIKSANAQFRQAITRLVLKTQIVNSKYTFQDFSNLMKEIEIFIKRSPKRQSVDISKWIPIVESAKNHLLGPNAEMNSAGKWEQAIQMGMEIHLQYLNYEYLFKRKDFFSRDGQFVLDEMVRGFLELLEKSKPLTEKVGIPFQETEKLLVSLEKAGVLGKKFKAMALMQAYSTLVSKVLDQESSKIEQTVVFKPKHLTVLKAEYKTWRTVQNFVDRLSYPLGYSSLLAATQEAETPSSYFPDIREDYVKQAWKEWVGHIDQPRPQLYSDTGEIVIDRNIKNSLQLTWSSMTRLNLMRMLNRLLHLGHGTQGTLNLSQEWLNEETFTDWYTDYWDFGVALQAFDKRTGNAGKRTTFEADHFVYAGDGSGKITLQESFELINIVFSAGLSGLENIQKDLQSSSCLLSDTDYFEKPWLDEACFKNELGRKFSSYFKNLPAMSQWVGSLSDKARDDFFNELIHFSRVDSKEKNRIESGDLRTLVVILHYIESLYIQFDVNGDDRLSYSELSDGSSRFISFFQKVYGIRDDSPLIRLYRWGIEHGFACLVVSGKMPSASSCTWQFVKDLTTFTPYSDRYLILKALNQFKDQIK